MCHVRLVGWKCDGKMYSSKPVCCWQFDSFIYCFNIEYLETLNLKTSRTPWMKLEKKVSKCQRGFFLVNTFLTIWQFYLLFKSTASWVCYCIGCNYEVRAYFKRGWGHTRSEATTDLAKTSVIRLRRVTTHWRISLPLYELSEVRELKQRSGHTRSEATTDLAKLRRVTAHWRTSLPFYEMR